MLQKAVTLQTLIAVPRLALCILLPSGLSVLIIPELLEEDTYLFTEVGNIMLSILWFS